MIQGGWRSLAAQVPYMDKVGGSNPSPPTI